ncbi:hypothetical protein TRFO_01791 [Tritrichomonas foetus]|uniref:Uncharacterized protein n=1 Tax=Tritrichomonas foetus TaxID=1144522 RepID=A0A1J4JQ37_9EUKA|nr:hypothetical protein TRFO_01791 [Tritrichomonas foetus]|eukprot:OHT01163.1 hypothetical protein TRFO_01791 [Tritrichomonas foetus]
MNSQLIKELNSLKTQFHEATAVRDQMQKIHDTNAKLASDLRKVRSEKDECESRMKCNIESLDRKRAELESEKKEIEQRAQKAIDETRQLFAKNKAELKNQLQQINQKYSDLQTLHKNQMSEYEALKTTCQSALSAAQTYFVIPFKNIEQLTEHLSQSTSRADNQLANVEKDQKSAAANSKLQQQITSLKQKIHNEHKARRDAESKLAKLQQQCTQCKAELEAKNKELESKVSEIEHKATVVELQKTQFVTNYEEQITALTKALEKQKEKTEEYRKQIEAHIPTASTTNEIPNLQATLDSKCAKIKTLQSTLVSIKQQNTLLLNQMKENDNIKETLRAKNQSLLDENMACTSEIQKLKEANGKLAIENSVVREQNDTLQGQIHVLTSNLNQAKNNLAESQSQAEKFRNSVAIAEMALTKQKQEIVDIISERTKCIDALKKQNVAMKSLEEQLIAVTEDHKLAQKRIADLTKDLRHNELMPKVEEIPETSWFCIDFPRELSSQIAELASEQMPTTTKLRRILSHIAKYYNSESEKINKELKINNKMNEEASLRMTHLFSALSPIIKESPPDYKTFISDPTSECQLLQSISKLHDSHIDLKVANIKLNNLLNEFAAKINSGDTSNIEEAFAAFFDNHNELIKQLNDEKNLNKKLKRALRTSKASVETEKKQAQESDKAKSSLITNLQNEKKRLQIDLSELSEKVVKMEFYVKQIESNHTNVLSSKSEEKDNEINAFMKTMEERKVEYISQIEERDEYLRKASHKIEKLEREVSQWKRTSELMKTAKSERDQQYNTLITKMEESNQKCQKARDTEITEIRAQYERIIEEIKLKNNNLRNMIEQANDSLNEATLQNKNMSVENAQLTTENQQLKTDIQTLLEEKKREKQLTDAKMKAIDLSNDTQRLLDIENIKARFDEEKRSLFEFVALNFHHLFDAREELSNETFKLLIEKAANELQRYIRQEATIRRLLGIRPSETPEEAISKLLLSIYQHQ